MKKIYFLIILLFSMPGASGQSAELDSLLKVLDQRKVLDSIYIDVANQIAGRYIFEEPRQTMYYAKIAFDLANDLNYEKGIIRALINIGNSYIDAGLPDQALSYYLQALRTNAYKYDYDYVRLHNNIGEVYRRQEMYDSSHKYFSKALVLANERLPQKPVIIYSNLGEVSLMQQKVRRAQKYFQACLENAKQENNLIGIGYGYYGLAECQSNLKNYDSAILFQRKAVNVREESSHQRGLIQSFLCLGEYYSQSNSDSSIFYWNKAVSHARLSGAFELLNQTYERIYRYYLGENDVFKVERKGK